MTVDRGTPSTTVPADPTPETAPETAPGATPPSHPLPARAVPSATVGRLALYLRALTTLAAQGVGVVSSDALATAAGVNAAMLRKDLSHIGSSGVRGVGYDVTRLTEQVEHTLGLTRRHAVALVGVGNLGHALAGYGGFSERGFAVAALFDVDPALVGTRLGGVEVLDVAHLDRVCAERGVTIGVVATPAAAAQGVCDRLVAAGVRSVLNFAPTLLTVPSGIEVRRVDLAAELQILSFHATRRAAGAAGRDAGEPPPGGSPPPGVPPRRGGHPARRSRNDTTDGRRRVHG